MEQIKQISADGGPDITLKSCKRGKKKSVLPCSSLWFRLSDFSSFRCLSLSLLTYLGRNTGCVYFFCLHFSDNRVLHIHKSNFECAVATATQQSMLILFSWCFVISHIFGKLKEGCVLSLFLRGETWFAMNSYFF